ncbi:DUF1275 family protein [Latilactobacillus sakei]|uniref:DUF1275 family protein n=1 Tax=Latilactobacillus sakei TaxID=1599 RepID=UPI003EB95055
MTEKMAISDKILYGGLLAAAGGFDSYTFLVHGQVFAGLQTGNLILLGDAYWSNEMGGINATHYPYPSFYVGNDFNAGCAASFQGS